MSEGSLGILGGTFDPVHLGHLAVAEQCQVQLNLGTICLVPSCRPPHRRPTVAPAADRLEMVRRAAEGRRGLLVDDREVRRGGVSYAVDTMRELSKDHPGRELVMLLGIDAALEFGSWHEAAVISQLASLAVFNRAGVQRVSRDALTAAGVPPSAAILEVHSPPVSASEIRRRLAAGEDVSGMLPASVLAYIRERGLYGTRI